MAPFDARQRHQEHPMNDQKNMILAIVLSALVLIGWQYFVGMPQMEKQKQEAQLRAEQAAAADDHAPLRERPAQPQVQPGTQGRKCRVRVARRRPGSQLTRASRDRRLAARRDRHAALRGSIALKGARIDDLALINIARRSIPKSPPIVLLSPSGSPQPFYVEFGWVPAAGVEPETARARYGLDAAGIRARCRPAGR